jgi:hypothetical protein
MAFLAAAPVTARQSTTVVVDAGMVYAEGFHAGLKEALRILLRTSGAAVPIALRRKVTEWEAHMIHREWLAGQGRPLPLERSAEALALIHAVLQAAGLGGRNVD